MKQTLNSKLQELLNEYCCENESDTPDYILANYLQSCLSAFDTAVKERREWHSTENTKDWQDKI